MPDIFRETSSQSIFGRLGSAFKGVIIGLLFIPGAIFMLFWNEGRAVKTAEGLKEGLSSVVSIEPGSVLPGNEGRLVHVSGDAVPGKPVVDSVFGISAPALRMKRTVEMYQWTEEKTTQTRKKVGGSTETETIYTYEKKWSAELIASGSFRHPEGHQNPAAMLAKSGSTVAKPVKLGAFSLSDSIVGKMDGDHPLHLTEDHLRALPPTWRSKAKLAGDGLYFGSDPALPVIGDQKVQFTVLEPGEFSILARQKDRGLQTYLTKAGLEIERVESGQVAADLMFKHAMDENTAMTWALRFGGTLLMALGIGLILSPLATAADVIPFVGNLVGAGTAFASLILSAIVSSVVIAISWFAVRPVLSGVLVALAIGVLVLGNTLGRKGEKSSRA